MEKQATTNTSLLKTKYAIPSRNKHLLSRNKLTQRLDEALCRKLTLITAPAGYGKTSTVLKWLDSTKVPHAWVCIDEGDNHALSFWRYVSAALDSISPGISKETEAVFASAELFQSNLHIHILVDCLWHVVSNFVLILDDLHLIKNPSVYESLSYFIHHLPFNMHLILISRTEPPMKLTKLSMKDELMRIQADQLRFTKEEIFQYFKEKGHYLQKDALDIIESYTEGWAAALVAVVLSLKDDPSIHHAITRSGGSNFQIEQYLSEDVFHLWTAQQQDFMEKTALLDKLCAPLCEAITGYDGSILMQELYDQNTFLAALGHEGVWFRYHPLFSDFLRKRLEKKNPCSISGLYQKAGAWLEANGYYEEAVEYFLKGGIYDSAIPLIEVHGGILLRHGNPFTVMSWLDKLPGKYTEHNIMLLILKAFNFTYRNDFAQAEHYIQKLSHLLKNTEHVSHNVYTSYLLVAANLHLLQGDLESVMTMISKVASYGFSNLMHTNYLDLNLYDISMYRAVYRSTVDFLRKNSAKFTSLLSDYRKLINTYPGYAPLINGELHYESGDSVKAIPFLTTAIEEAINGKCPGALVPAMVTMAKIKHAHGDLSCALETLEQCEKIVATYHKPHWSYMLKAFKVRLFIDADNTEPVSHWMAESKLSTYHELSRVREFEMIVYARVLIKKRRYLHANILLNRLLSFSEGLGRNHSIVEILNLLAITAMKSLNEEDAFLYISRSLDIGMEEGYVRSFVDELSPMLSVLELFIRRSTKRNKLTAYAKNLLLWTQEASRSFFYPSDCSTIQKKLTPSEKKVLQLIIKGYTNKEIAAKLFITARTASAHTTNIYKKLSVKNRIQCVQKATGVSLGIG